MLSALEVTAAEFAVVEHVVVPDGAVVDGVLVEICVLAISCLSWKLKNSNYTYKKMLIITTIFTFPFTPKL